MKLLFDQNISFRAVNLLKDIFPEAIHINDCDLESASDHKIWCYAKDNHYHIVTFDADFFDMVTLYGHPPKIIWLRMGNSISKHLAHILKSRSEQIIAFLNDTQHDESACLELR